MENSAEFCEYFDSINLIANEGEAYEGELETMVNDIWTSYVNCCISSAEYDYLMELINDL